MISKALIFSLLLLFTPIYSQSLTQPGAGTRGSCSLPGDYNYAFRDHPIRTVVASAPAHPPRQYSYNPKAHPNTVPVKCTYKPSQPHYDNSGSSGYDAPCGYQSRCEANKRVDSDQGPQYYGSCGECGRGCDGESCGECGRPYYHQNQYYQNDYQLPRYDGSMYADGSKGFGKGLVKPKMAEKPEVKMGTVDPYADGFLMPEVVGGGEENVEISGLGEKGKEVYQGKGVGKLKGKIKNAMGKEASKGAMKKSRDGKGRRMGL